MENRLVNHPGPSIKFCLDYYHTPYSRYMASGNKQGKYYFFNVKVPYLVQINFYYGCKRPYKHIPRIIKRINYLYNLNVKWKDTPRENGIDYDTWLEYYSRV